MSRTVDALQKELRESVFHYAADGKKAAGRALGTIVELATYYKLCSMGLASNLIIEKPIAEFGRPDISHNVEFSIHRKIASDTVSVARMGGRPLTARNLKTLGDFDISRPSEQIITTDNVLKNSALIGERDGTFTVANVNSVSPDLVEVEVSLLSASPLAIFECKRVGVEEGMKKGPQSIEKAKQGAYVARSVSALQKIISKNGVEFGVVQGADGEWVAKPYADLLNGLVYSGESSFVGLVLTVGVTSNHGNWFTADSMNKEMKVLAAAYDWLFFLTDEGLLEFVHDVVLNEAPAFVPIRNAFLASYTGTKGLNRFTKTRVDVQADRALRNYFKSHSDRTDSWFNVIQPVGGTFAELSRQLTSLLGQKPA